MSDKFTLLRNGQPLVDDAGKKWEDMTWPETAVVEIYDVRSWQRVSPGIVTLTKAQPPPPVEPPPVDPPPPPVEDPDDDPPPPPAPNSEFIDAVTEAWRRNKPLNWFGGDVMLKQPILLIASENKTNFHLNMNEANVFCDFNDRTKYAITLRITGSNLNIREFGIEEIKFRRVTPYAGGILLECNRNDSWIYSFDINSIACGGHEEHAIWLRGSVFECDLEYLRSTSGKGLFRATVDGSLDPKGQKGLPSAMVGRNWRPRDFTGDAVLLDAATRYQEPFDLRLTEGYFVTGLGDGMGIMAPSGINTVEGVGFENLQGGAAMYLGYRGGRVIRCEATNSHANARLGTYNSEGGWQEPPIGVAYLAQVQLANSVTLDGCKLEEHSGGTGLRLAKVQDLGGGSILLNPSRSDFDGNDIDTNVPNNKFNIVAYRNRM
jgi:hypothetical protein